MSKPKNPLAVALGKLGAGHPKTLSEDQRAIRRERMNALNAKRMASKLDQRKALSDTCPASE